MTIHATSAASQSPPSDMATLAREAAARAKASCGHVPAVFRSRRHGGRLQTLVLTEVMQREAMILDLRKAVLRRDMRAVHRLEAELRSLTHRMMVRGA